MPDRAGRRSWASGSDKTRSSERLPTPGLSQQSGQRMAGPAIESTDLPPQETPAVGRQRLWRFLRAALRPGLVGAAAVYPLATVLARWDWHADVLTPFEIPALAITLLAMIASVRRRHFWLAGPLLALAVFQSMPLV